MNYTTKLRTTCGLVAIVTCSLATTGAQAQSSTNAAPQSATAKDAAGDGLNVIIVSAQKRPENMQDTPISMTALSAKDLQNLKLSDASQVAQQVPSLTVQTPFGSVQPIFALRGVSLVDYSQHQQGPIAMYVDEDYKGAGVFRAQQLYDIERVEVLRGPQGTLFGRNSTGGAVNIYTVQPDLDGTEGFASAGVGNFGLHEASGAIEVTPVDDVLGIRIAFDARETDGFLKALTPGLKNFGNDSGYAVRVTTAYHPSDAVRLSLTYSHARSDTRPAGYTVKNIGEDGIGWAGFYNEGYGFYDVGSGDQGYLKVDNDSVLLRGEFDVATDLTLTSLSSFNKGRFRAYSDDDSTAVNILADGSDAKAKVWSQELRLASTRTYGFNWLLGLAASTEDITSATRYDSYGYFSEDVNGTPSCLLDYESGCVYTNRFTMNRRSLAVFAHASYDLSDKFTLEGGLRYSNDRTSIDSYTAYLGYFDPTSGDPVYGVEELISAPPVDEFTNSNLSGKISARYQFTPDSQLYASYSRGYRSGSFNGYAYFDPSEVNIVKPETLDAFEVGTKNEFFDHKLRLNGALFYYKYKNQQFLDITDEGLEVLVNAPRSRIWGGEIEAAVAPTRNLTLSASAGYVNSQYQELTLSDTDLSGNRLASAPHWTVNLAGNWTILPATDAETSLHVDARYTSLQYYDAFNSSDIAQPAYWIVNGRITKPVGETGLEFGAWIKNAFDTKYYAYVVDYQAYMNANLNTPGLPRTYGLDVTYRF